MKLNEDFLKSYVPEDRFHTSNEEVSLVISNTLLEGKRIDELSVINLKTLRDIIVDFYDPMISREDDFKYMSSMQSVTAVIDFYIYL